MIEDKDHVRVNLCVEAAEEFLIAENSNKGTTNLIAQEFLQRAHRGLDSHNCKLCMSYYNYCASLLCQANALENGKISLQRSIEDIQKAKQFAEESILGYQEIEHPNFSNSSDLLLELERVEQIMKKPRKIFLSHKSEDKSMVRNIHSALKDLKFEPWLDEEALIAGVSRDRSIRAGMKESCACIFFITNNFIDEKFIKSEIDWAHDEKIRRENSDFSIIILVFPDVDSDKVIPDIFKHLIWKEVSSELEALSVIIKSLPLEHQLPVWRDE